MLELFTSQGCSSCPPADRWMSRLLQRPGLWKDYVPLAFHVDYWDYIGWRDRFASAAYSDRQRTYAEEGGASVIYTPGFLVNGKEWRRWHSESEPQTGANLAGDLTATIDKGTASVRYLPVSAGHPSLLATVAILGFGLESSVIAGENSGRVLHNDFVVLGTSQSSMSSDGGHYVADIPVPVFDTKVDRVAVAVWVSTVDAQSPLQAAGGWLEN
jgi:hypothetical protein